MTEEQLKALADEVHDAYKVIIHGCSSLNLLIHRIVEKNREFNYKYADLLEPNFFQDVCKEHIISIPNLPQEWYDAMRCL